MYLKNGQKLIQKIYKNDKNINRMKNSQFKTKLEDK